MDFLDDLRERRLKYVEGCKANEKDIELDIFDDFYPDKAHFIYELLQNSEDANATDVLFDLSQDKITYQHDGDPFDEEDVRGITGVGSSRKKYSRDKIGQFGVGFKSVLIYSRTPRIWSPTFSFEITDKVVPDRIGPKPALGNRTLIELPFNSEKRKPEESVEEIKTRFDDMQHIDLLFLSNLKRIQWQVEGKPIRSLTRIHHSEHHVEIVHRCCEDKDSRHYLKYARNIDEKASRNVAVAFELRENNSEFDRNVPLSEQFRIKSVEKGCVSVYFPTAKEESGLRFHVHAPFVPSIDRICIKDTHINESLFKELALLASESLVSIRNEGFLDRKFLKVLPSKYDEVSEKYCCIRNEIIEVMNEQPLTPAYSGSHAPAKRLLQASSQWKRIFAREDLNLLLCNELNEWDWALSIGSDLVVGRVLRSLNIQEFTVNRFRNLIIDKQNSGTARNMGDPSESSDHSADAPGICEIFSGKTDEWHQKFYALLNDESIKKNNNAKLFDDVCIVRLSSGKYETGKNCFFPDCDENVNKEFDCVDESVYTYGDDKGEMNSSFTFLKNIGVREIGSKEIVEQILGSKYEKRDTSLQEGYRMKSITFDENTRDILRLIEIVNSSMPSMKHDLISVIREYRLVRTVDNEWESPPYVYIDSPYMDTGLHEYYDYVKEIVPESSRESCRSIGMEVNGIAKRIAAGYNNEKLLKSVIVDFAIAIGIQSELPVCRKKCCDNPCSEELISNSGYQSFSEKHGIDVDYHVPFLDEVLENPDPRISRIVWDRMFNDDDDSTYCLARFKRNSKEQERTAASSLLHSLKSNKWIPQENGKFASPSEASHDYLLQTDFPFRWNNQFVESIEFGTNNEQQRTIRLARELGFDSLEALGRAKQFAKLPIAVQDEILNKYGN